VTKPVDPAELIARVRRLVGPPGTRGNGTAAETKLASLTRREHEVLELLTHGYRQQEIASKLVITPRTVATHIQHILGKLEVRSRAEAVAVALRERADVHGHGQPSPPPVLAS
jgi:DNA-binding NarL/FixJ family response regulator